MLSILDLSLCLSSMMGRAVNAESMAAIHTPSSGAVVLLWRERRH
jgi:hypothetical protein